jgi:hypothetical protein
MLVKTMRWKQFAKTTRHTLTKATHAGQTARHCLQHRQQKMAAGSVRAGGKRPSWTQPTICDRTETLMLQAGLRSR